MRGADLGVAFLVFAYDFRAAEAFFVGRVLVALRAEVFTAVARFAFGREDLALITRFEAFAEARLADRRDVGRRKPFVRLLLMC